MTRFITLAPVRVLCPLALLVMLVVAGSAVAQTVVRVSETVTVFSRPTEQSPAIDTLPTGTEVQTLETMADDPAWLKVVLPGAFPRVGYLAARSTKPAVGLGPTLAIAPVQVTAPVIAAPTSVVASASSPSDVVEPLGVAPAPALLITPMPAAQQTGLASLKNVHRIYVEKMPNDLDQYINAEITKQLAGRVMVVLKKEDADAILRGTGEAKTGVGAAITGRYLGLHDNATGSISLLDKTESLVLWAAEAGDRNMWVGFMARGGPRKVADRLVHDLKKAMEKNR